MSNERILIVEDEANLGQTLREYLADKGYTCFHVSNCHEATKLFDSEDTPGIILMDIGLPDGDGIELAKQFRQKRQDFVLIFLSAQNDPETKYQGLEMGAEDYITKPFDLRELTLRLDKALKTHHKLSEYQDIIQLGALQIKFKSYEAVNADGETFSLGQKECAILELLYTYKNEVVSRDQIIDKVWGENSFPTNRTVDNYIVKLRKWTQTDKSNSVEIKSVRGVGYQLVIKEG